MVKKLVIKFLGKYGEKNNVDEFFCKIVKKFLWGKKTVVQFVNPYNDKKYMCCYGDVYGTFVNYVLGTVYDEYGKMAREYDAMIFDACVDKIEIIKNDVKTIVKITVELFFD